MKKIRVAVNGFGRIGRICSRILLSKEEIELVAVNDLSDTRTLSHLFKYDSVHRTYPGDVSCNEKEMIVDGKKILFFSERNPAQLPWEKLNIDIVIESTGNFRDEESASLHLKAGAKKVIISAPAKEGNIKSVVIGINDSILDGTEKIVSNASCTTNCTAPLIQIIDEVCGVESGFISTVHSYTTDQRLHDAPHSDLRRARAAAVSIVPTTTGAAKAITKIFPHLDGKLGGAGIRVPVPNGSLTDLTCIVKKDISKAQLNEAFKKAAEGKLKGILQYTSDPIVSVDILGNSHSCIFDSELTFVLGKMIKVVGWYDNEAGYSNRLAELVVKMGG